MSFPLVSGVANTARAPQALSPGVFGTGPGVSRGPHSKGGGAAADLIEQHQGAVGGVVPGCWPFPAICQPMKVIGGPGRIKSTAPPG